MSLIIFSFFLLAILFLIYFVYKKNQSVPFLGSFIRRQYLKARFKIWDDLSISDQLDKNHQNLNLLQKLRYQTHKLESTIFYYLALLFKSSLDSFLLLNCDRKAEECKDDDYPIHLVKKKQIFTKSAYVLFLLIIANISTGLITSLIFPNIFKTHASTLTYSSQVEWQTGTADANLDLTTSPGDITLGLSSVGYSATHTSQADFQAGTADANIDLTTSAGDALLSFSASYNFWTANGVSVVSGVNDQDSIDFKRAMIPDGSGGSIVAWLNSNGSTNDLYVQKINSSGVAQWTAGGVSISTLCTGQYVPAVSSIVSDGSGGAIIVWDDNRNGNNDIYAQRINSAGVVQWTAEGVPISTDVNNQRHASMISDGSGGAIIAWSDNRSGNYDIYAQRVNSAGAVQWTADGLSIVTEASNQGLPNITSDGSGGAIIAFTDLRNGNTDIYAQKINSSGVAQWTADGESIVTAVGTQDFYIASDYNIITDGSGGAIITWQDQRAGNYDIYSQKINSAGVVQWTADGVAVGVEAGNQRYPVMVADVSNGAMITWRDERNGDPDIYVQKIDSAGVVQFAANGVLVSTNLSAKISTNVISDGSGGAILTWTDVRTGNYDVYAQKIDSSGTSLWTADGVPVTALAGNQGYAHIVSDGSGGAILSWVSDAAGNNDIYAQRLGESGLYISPGVFTSPVIDAGSSVSWSTLSATETKPANTDITYETRTTASTTPYNMALSANGSTATASTYLSLGGNDYTGDKAIDGTTWVSGSNSSAWVNGAEVSLGSPQWLEIDLPSSQSISFVKASSTNIGIQFSPVAYEIQVWTNGAWNSVAASSTNTMAEFTHSFTATTTDKVRLYITQAYNNHAVVGTAFDLVAISEFEIYASNPTDPWSSWTSTTGTTINSPAGQYLQYRATLSTTDTTVTPTLSAVTVSAPNIYHSSGMYTSAVLDNGNTVTWNSITAASTTPASTAIELAYRIGTTAVPDGAWSDWATTTGAIATSSQYLQYRAFLSTTDTSVTPTLASIALDYTSDIIPPTVDSTSPISSATSVATSTVITALFSEAIATSTVTASTFTLTQGATPLSGTVSYNGLTATFTPDASLDYSTVYVATITTGVQDLASNPLASNNSWSFTTDARPTIVSISPANNNNEVSIGSVISATFSKNMATSTISNSSFSVRDSNSGVGGTINYQNKIATFTPSRELECSREYYVTLRTSIADLSGETISANRTWQFMTSCSSSNANNNSAPVAVDPTTTVVSTATENSEASNTPTVYTETNPTNPAAPTAPNISSASGSMSTTSTSSTTPTVVVQPTLSLTDKLIPGQIDTDVPTLKQMLVDLGYLPTTTDTTETTFDEAVAEAVKSFQSDNNIPTTGVLGEQTITALNRAWLELGKISTVDEDSMKEELARTTEELGMATGSLNTEPAPQVISIASQKKSSLAGFKIAIQEVKEKIANSVVVASTNTALVFSLVALTSIQLAGQVSSISQVPYIFINLFGFLAYRRRRNAGTVYDAKTGKPVSFAKVVIYDKKTRQAMETKVTDKHGAYFFLVPKGEYTIIASKVGYDLLSTEAMEKAQTIYGSAYAKGKVLEFEKDDLVNVNIPIQRSQESKLENLFTHPVTVKILSVLFGIGLLISLIMALAKPTLANYVVVAVYFTLAIIKYANLAIPRWGIIRVEAGDIQPYSIVEAVNARTKKFFSRTVADEHGRYAFIFNPGKYNLEIKTISGRTAKGRVEIKKREVIGKNIAIKE